jgi:hypothetical protein
MTGRTGPEGRGTLGEAAAGQSIGIVSGAAAAQAPALAGASRVVDTTAPVRVGDKRAHWRRRAAYAVMITYAILMFIPVRVVADHVVQDPSGFGPADLHPSAVHTWTPAIRLPEPEPVDRPPVRQQRRDRPRGDGLEPAPREPRRLRLRPAALPGREVLFLVVLATLMIPDQLRLVPVYLIMNALGLTRGPASTSRCSS